MRREQLKTLGNDSQKENQDQKKDIKKHEKGTFCQRDRENWILLGECEVQGRMHPVRT